MVRHSESRTESRIIYETPNVHFRPLPFYDTLDSLIRPAGLVSDGILGRLNESQLEFKFTVKQADDLAMSCGSNQVILRFCNLDDSSEQDDNFPHSASVFINNASIPLPQEISNPNRPNIPPKRPGQFLDVTKFCKICPYIQNRINVKWFVDPLEPNRSYVITLILATRVDTDTLLSRIRERGLSDPEMTKKIILDSDNEIATTNLQSSLVCPLGKMRMTMPCKSMTCQHIPCFDALFYLQMNEKKASWTCPICYKPAYFRDLLLDGYFMDILANTGQNVTEVKLNSDGSWNPVMKMEQPTSASGPPPEVITISDDDD